MITKLDIINLVPMVMEELTPAERHDLIVMFKDMISKYEHTSLESCKDCQGWGVYRVLFLSRGDSYETRSFQMKAIILTEETMKELFWEGSTEKGDFTVVETSKWIDDGKYQYQELIVNHKDHFFKTQVNRYGDYFSGYEYDWEYPAPFTGLPVVKKEIKSYEWTEL